MTIVIKQTKQTIMTLCHLQLEPQRYSVAVKIIGIESYVFEKGNKH